jgi:hypothetical protein
VRFKGLAADAAVAHPFIALPAKAAATHGILDVEAAGVLLIENQETFQALSRTSVPEEWLCIWLEGYVSHALPLFLARLPNIPLAAWADLDPPGIAIVTDLMTKSGREVIPVCMTAELDRAGYLLGEEPEDLERWRIQAQTQTTTAPVALRPLARAIAGNGGLRCQQEGLHELVLTHLHDELRQLAAR